MNTSLQLLFVLGFFLTACGTANEKELLNLRKENARLKEKLDTYDNAIVLTYENLYDYMGALAVGPVEV